MFKAECIQRGGPCVNPNNNFVPKLLTGDAGNRYSRETTRAGKCGGVGWKGAIIIEEQHFTDSFGPGEANHYCWPLFS